jgi:MinD-like ATPase involved in chromosome partitioning or flagellar assembly
MKVVVRDLPTYPFHVLINMAHSATQARQVFDSLQQILNRFLGYQPGDAGWIVADPAVGRAVVQQTPFTVMAPDCPAAQAVGQLVDRLVGTAREPRTTTPFWQRLAGWARAK